MTAANSSTKQTFRLADRLAAARRGRFVGREAELELVRSALLAAEPPFVVLHLYGPGGVGKSTLLREYARIAAEAARPVIRLDGRNLEPSPPGFLLALRQALGFKENDSTLDGLNWPAEGMLLIDTYESLVSLDAWLRDTFLPQLPGHSLVVTAGRNPPDPGLAQLAITSGPILTQGYPAAQSPPRRKPNLLDGSGHPCQPAPGGTGLYPRASVGLIAGG